MNYILTLNDALNLFIKVNHDATRSLLVTFSVFKSCVFIANFEDIPEAYPRLPHSRKMKNFAIIVND